MDRAAGTFVLPFDTGALPAPAGEWAFLNAASHPALGSVFAGARLVCEQPMRPDFRALQETGFDAEARLADAPSARFDGALVLLGRHKRLNQWQIARAARLVRPGAPVMVAGDKKLGVASTRKWTAARVPPAGSLSKNHAQLFWFAADIGPFADVELPQTEPAPGMVAAPGMFSCDHVDPGSALLADHIDTRISGAVADLGAGWGYLSAQVLTKARPRTLALIEAYRPALDVAMRNVAALSGDVPVEDHWLDIASEPLPGPLDWVVMNPPFHTGRAGEPELGQRFIRSAASALTADGRLLAVANRHLPYERAIGELFTKVSLLTEDTGFKVIEASGPIRRGRGPRR